MGGGSGMRASRYVVEEGMMNKKCSPWSGVSGDSRLVVTARALLPWK